MQIEIKLAQENDIPQITTLWEECFTTDKEYLYLVFTSLFYKSEVYTLLEGKVAVSSLFLIPIDYTNSHLDGKEVILHGKYLYGVCTAKKHQNKGYSKLLLKSVIERINRVNNKIIHNKNTTYKYHNSKNVIDFIITRPASPSLFNFYRNQGFCIDVPRGTININDILEASIDNSSVEIANKIYNRIISNHSNRFIWSKELLEYMHSIGEFEHESYPTLKTPNTKNVPSNYAIEEYALLMNIGKDVSNRDYSKAYFQYTME